MNINELTPHEKSVMLAKLCGWWVTKENYLVMDDSIVNLLGGWSEAVA